MCRFLERNKCYFADVGSCVYEVESIDGFDSTTSLAIYAADNMFATVWGGGGVWGVKS